MKSPHITVTVFAAAAAAALSTLCTSCAGGQSGTGKDGPVTIDIAANYPKEEITLQEIAEVEYTPLAISPEVLLTPTDRIFHLSPESIMVRSSNNIFIFNPDGTIATHFNRQGRGQGDYMTISDIAFDAAAGEIFVTDIVPPARIQVYTLDGTHRRTLPLPEGSRLETFDFDPATLLVYDTSGIPTNEQYTTRPYRLMSKADGSITDTLAIHTPTRYSNTTVIDMPPAADGRRMVQVFALQTINHRLGAPDGAFTLADISSDTIYRYTRDRVLTPAFVRTPSVHASEPRTIWTTPLNTASFTLLEVATLDFDRAIAGNGFDSRTLMYDHSTGRITQPTFRDANNPSAEWTMAFYDTPGQPNTTAKLLDPLRLVEAREKGELQGLLAQIAEKIKEDDNPILMTVKFN